VLANIVSDTVPRGVLGSNPHSRKWINTIGTVWTRNNVIKASFNVSKILTLRDFFMRRTIAFKILIQSKLIGDFRPDFTSFCGQDAFLASESGTKLFEAVSGIRMHIK
jgi:hypothetical protein